MIFYIKVVVKAEVCFRMGDCQDTGQRDRGGGMRRGSCVSPPSRFFYKGELIL